MIWRSIKRRLRILDSDRGRNYGWYVELDGRPIAILADPESVPNNESWHVYTVVPTTADAEEIKALATDEFWYGDNLQQKRLSYVNREVGSRSTDGWAGGLHALEDGTIKAGMRSLYVPVPLPWEEILLWLRDLWRGKNWY